MDARSEKNLIGVHPDMAAVIREASENPPVPFIVTEGVRSLDRQKELVAAGASWTLKSRHLTGHAVDVACLVGGEVRWDWPLYRTLAAHIKAIAVLRSVPLEWGGSWPKDKQDGPHFQLSRSAYP
jgi:peptidoglycan L-alanyl-D-glutamate endopeptidase CwlK